MDRSKKDMTSAIVDGLLRLIAAGGLITTVVIAPNAVQALDKPVSKFLDKLDERSRERELRRITYYMKSRGLIKYSPNDYEHGIEITKEGLRRLKKSNYDDLSIPTPEKWDKKWRLVFFDVPIEANKQRGMLTYKLRSLGFQQLQKSIWVHPFPCKPEIEAITEFLGIRKYLTYIEINKIDSEKQLRTRFRKLLSQTAT